MTDYKCKSVKVVINWARVHIIFRKLLTLCLCWNIHELDSQYPLDKSEREIHMKLNPAWMCEYCKNIIANGTHLLLAWETKLCWQHHGTANTLGFTLENTTIPAHMLLMATTHIPHQLYKVYTTRPSPAYTNTHCTGMTSVATPNPHAVSVSHFQTL